MTNNIGKTNIWFLLGICLILIIIGFSVYKTFLNYQQLLKGNGKSSEATTSENATSSSSLNPFSGVKLMLALENKTVLMVIAYKDFRDEEYFKPRQLFERGGGKVKTASTDKGTAVGADGNTVDVDILVKEVNVSDFDAVVFIGGPGALTYLDNEDSYKIAKEADSHNKVVAAICIAPVILAKAGVLDGRFATVWTSPTDISAVGILNKNGAIYQSGPVVVFANRIITANGPEAAEEFGMKVIDAIAGQ